MIIWQGFGFMVFVIVFGCSLIANLIFDAEAGHGYYDHHKWPFAVSLTVSAGLCWFYAKYLGKRPGRVVIDKQTGKEFTIGRRHTLFFIPVLYWAPILLACSLILLVLQFTH
jgi:hypothetical protein